ncbi:MAG: TerC family protein [Pseudobdellovibrionaceae bacterium]
MSEYLSFLSDPEGWAALLTLTVLEIVLGIDNIIFIAILSDRLPKEKQALARKLGLAAALITRLLLISLVFMLAHIMIPLFTLMDHEVTIRDLLLFFGGLFLLAKGTIEIHDKMEEDEANDLRKGAGHSFAMVIMQIAVMDIVFSFDSVITAIGMTDHISVMILAILISVVIMVMAIDSISEFINEHPTVKILGLSYMLLIGLSLMAEATGHHIPKGYLYFAMGFSFLVEMINMRIRKKKAA